MNYEFTLFSTAGGIVKNYNFQLDVVDILHQQISGIKQHVFFEDSITDKFGTCNI